MVSTTRAFVFRLRPTAKQQVLLRAMLNDHRHLYNAALQERRDAWDTRTKRGVTDPKDQFGKIGFAIQSAQLPAIRASDPDQARWSATSQQQTLRKLNKSFADFYRRCRKGQTPGYPRFKPEKRWDSVEFRDGDGARWDSVPTGRDDSRRVYLQGVGHIKTSTHRPIRGTVATIRVKRQGDHRAHTRWVVIVTCNNVPLKVLPRTSRVIGIDMATGDNGLAYTSHGDRIDNLQPHKHAAQRLTRLQQQRSKTRRGSMPYRDLTRQLARAHARIARQRYDHHHQVAARLVAGYDIICIEGLPVASMTRRAKAKPDPDAPGAFLPNGARAKAGLNRSIRDAGWGQFIAILKDKAACAGRQVIVVNPAYTSQTCVQCQRTDPASRSGKVFYCTGCGHYDDADINAAQTILCVGTGLVPEQPTRAA